MRSFTICFIWFSYFQCNNSITKPEVQEEFYHLPSSDLINEQISALDSINIPFQLRGFCYAYSSDKNKERSNGEAHSSNFPKNTENMFSITGFYLLINEKAFTKINEKFLGCKLYLINRTDSLVTLSAQDSRLNIIPEAKDKNGEWKPIGYNPSSWCGNSYHTIKLDNNEFWEFSIPIFTGPFHTRYTLIYGDSVKFSSNEITGCINPSQFDTENKQGHSPVDLMDPYAE